MGSGRSGGEKRGSGENIAATDQDPGGGTAIRYMTPMGGSFALRSAYRKLGPES